MFGTIKSIDDNIVVIDNLSKKAVSNIMNCHIIFEEADRKIVGEIVFVDENAVKALLVGEIINGIFSSGILRKPSSNVRIRIISLPELEIIYGKNELTSDRLLLGESPIYKNFNISVSLDSFFANHSAIVGNTGSGKSCCVARLFQNLFLIGKHKPVNAHIVLFDAYGEYANTFNGLDNVGLKFCKYTSSINDGSGSMLSFPANFLDADDLALLLQASSNEQLPVLEKTLKLVKIFKGNSEEAKKYKNNIIANCLQDILTSGRSSTQIRDQIIAVLTNYSTETLNLDSIIPQVGYNRTFRQCLLIDNQGKMLSIFDVVNFLQQFDRVNLENISLHENITYDLEDIFYALQFALISEGSINNDISYKQNNILKTRLQSIINSDKNTIFKPTGYSTKNDFIEDMIMGKQIIDINLSNFDDRFAKIITKLYSKLFFNYTVNDFKDDFSINIVLEEAHRYVQNDSDIDIIGYNIFDRITKEGRKYGTILTFITQRPTELSETALSQCSNFIVFRVYHPKDLEIIRNLSTNVSDATIEHIKSLNPGTGMAFGIAFSIPTLINFNLPDPLPRSTSISVSNTWFEKSTE